MRSSVPLILRNFTAIDHLIFLLIFRIPDKPSDKSSKSISQNTLHQDPFYTQEGSIEYTSLFILGVHLEIKLEVIKDSISSVLTLLLAKSTIFLHKQYHYQESIWRIKCLNADFISQIYLRIKLIKMVGKVLVTGATGYLASHVINELLQRGYEVVGTVRSLANKEKYAFLYELPHAKERLEMREADLLNAESWDEALKGISSILHVASPIPPGIPKHEDQLIKPAVDGTKNVVNAALKNKVKRIIFTSSCLTVMVRTDGKIANEDDWSQVELLHHYPKSKYLAEKAFWELGENHKEELEFVSILPSLVTGPAFAKHGNSSEAFVSQILNGGYPGIPTPATEYAAVDVRDVAIAQVNALEYPEAKGRRFIVSGYSVLSSDVFEILRSKYGQLGYNIASNPIDAEGIKQSGHGPSLRVVGFLGKKFKVDNSRAIKELGLKYRGAEESILDQAARQIELGIVAKK